MKEMLKTRMGAASKSARWNVRAGLALTMGDCVALAAIGSGPGLSMGSNSPHFPSDAQDSPSVFEMDFRSGFRSSPEATSQEPGKAR